MQTTSTDGDPYSFTSAWMSAELGEEWVYVDLGARFEFARLQPYWIARAADDSAQVSDDAENWHDLMALPGEAGLVDDLKLAQPAQCRYVRAFLTRPSSPYGYILSGLEVYGRVGFAVRPKPAPPAAGDGRLLWLPLMPGESRTLVTEVDEGDTRGEKSAIVVCGLRHSPPPCRLCAVPSSGERAK